MYVRVKDPDTGHEFDVPETSHLLRKGLVRRVKQDRYPPSPVPRPAKHHVDLPAVRRGAKEDQGSEAPTAAGQTAAQDHQDDPSEADAPEVAATAEEP